MLFAFQIIPVTSSRNCLCILRQGWPNCGTWKLYKWRDRGVV